VLGTNIMDNTDADKLIKQFEEFCETQLYTSFFDHNDIRIRPTTPVVFHSIDKSKPDRVVEMPYLENW